MPDTTHECPKTGCTARVPRSQFACRTHYWELPKHLRDELYDSYKSGNVGWHADVMMECVQVLNVT